MIQITFTGTDKKKKKRFLLSPAPRYGAADKWKMRLDHMKEDHIMSRRKLLINERGL